MNYFKKVLIALYYKKWGYPSVCKTTGIAPKSARIGPKCLSRCFKLLCSDNWYRVARPILALFKPCSDVFTCIGIVLTNSFEDLYQHILGPIPMVLIIVFLSSGEDFTNYFQFLTNK